MTLSRATSIFQILLMPLSKHPQCILSPRSSIWSLQALMGHWNLVRPSISFQPLEIKMQAFCLGHSPTPTERSRGRIRVRSCPSSRCCLMTPPGLTCRLRARVQQRSPASSNCSWAAAVTCPDPRGSSLVTRLRVSPCRGRGWLPRTPSARPWPGGWSWTGRQRGG